MGSAFSKFQAFSFASLLAKPFVDWEAFKLGLIDDGGKIIQKPKTGPEKKALNAFNNLIRKIKRILLRYVPDQRLIGFLIATYLLKTESDAESITYKIDQKLTDTEQKILYKNLNEYITITQG